jgi:pyruvate dehydrogenase E2 component (dihydrolipoamide acetyltransferase)
MNDAHRWIDLDEPEPEVVVRPGGSSAEERESFIAALLPQLDPLPAPAPAPAAPAPALPAAPVPRPAPLRTAPMPAAPPGAVSPFLAPGAFPAQVQAPPTIPCPVMKVGGTTKPVRDDSVERAVAAAHEALDAQWRERAARDPRVREELTRRYQTLWAWLRERRLGR